ncbi:hypothetical protein AB7M70_011846 [Bradyrhizobium japonicum]
MEGDDLLKFLLYAVIGGVAGWVFRWVAALIELILVVGIGSLFTGFKGTLADKMEWYPKRMFFLILLKNVVVGSINALMIYIITFNFMLYYNGNYWVYVIASVFWSFLILSYTPAFVGMYFMTSTVSLVLMWMGFSILAPLVVAPITFIISLAYYYGRINVILEDEQMRHHFSI